ncbi:RNA-binding domain-containing protein [Methanococcus vannielii]|jgi:RNA binding exosome subunit|nr:RNA-binding domain-containing protein [Methanococcus vannielii]
MVNNVTISTIQNATEDEEKVLDTLSFFLPEIINETDIIAETVETEGNFGNPIEIHTITVEGKKARLVFEYVIDLLKTDERNINKIKDDLDLRIEKNKLYLRFDKQKACLGECKLLDGDDTVRIVVNFKIFTPSGKEEKVRQEVLKRLENRGVF